jgi:hypothetical protein
MKYILLTLALLLSVCLLAQIISPVATKSPFTYYVNTSTGNDTYLGKSPSTAWATTTKADTVALTGSQSVGYSTGGSYTVYRTGPYTPYIVDDFTGTNGTALTAHTANLGGSWTAASGVTWIESNTAQWHSGLGFQVIDTGHADEDITATFIQGTASSGAIVFRYTSTSNFWYLLMNYNQNYFSIYKDAATVITDMGDTPLTGGSYPATYTAHIRLIGNQIHCDVSLSGVLAAEVDVNDSFNATATKVGMRAGGAGQAIDTLRVTALPLSYRAPATLMSAISATNASTPLTLATYDGSGQVVHPSVVHFASPWNGYSYWMVATPFPSSNAAYENPSLWVSNDNSTWIVPPGVTNPIVAAPGGGYINNDPDLLLGPDGLLYLFWGTYDATGSPMVDIYYITSSDGVNWSGSTSIMSSATNTIMSPTIVWHAGMWYMWVISNTGGNFDGYPLLYTGINLGSLTGPIICPIDTRYYLTTVASPWHLEVRWNPSGGFFDMVYVALNAPAGLYWLRSYDGVNWAMVGTTPFLTKGTTGHFDATELYRSTFQPNGSNYDLWYSAEAATGYWEVGYTLVTITP